MELILIPVLLFTGAALVHMGINGAPSFVQIPASLPVDNLARSLRSAILPNPTAIRVRRPVAHLKPISDPKVELTDVLLADLLTEMIQFREEIDALKQRLDGLEAAKKPAPRQTARKSA